MESLLASQMKQLASLKPLEQEILDQLENSEDPLTCAELLERIPNVPDRETLSREIFRLATEGTIARAGEIEAPPGSPRKTVSFYTLPPREAEAKKKEPSTPAGNPIKALIAEAISGVTQDQAISKEALIARCKTEASRAAISATLKRMVSEGTVLAAFGHTTARRYFDLRTLSGSPSEKASPSTPSPKKTVATATSLPPEPPPPKTPLDIDFAIHADGRLSIVDGSHCLILPPDATRRLGHFLGCFALPSTSL